MNTSRNVTHFKLLKIDHVLAKQKKLFKIVFFKKREKRTKRLTEAVKK